MLPWNYGFQWNTGHVVFLGAFYTVLTVVGITLLAAVRRSRQALIQKRVEEIGWHADFHDLPASDRTCRHELTGELAHRECPNAFDCRHCKTHAKLVAHRPVQLTNVGDEEIFGMAFPLDRYYHRGHAWAHPEPDGTVTIGLDDLGQRLVGAPDAVDLPPAGTHVEANGTAFRIHKREADVRVLCPIDGVVVETGGAADKWYLRVLPGVLGEPAFRHLLRGPEVKPWLLREMERLQLSLVAQGATPTLADGGVPVADISQGYPKTDWDAVCGSMFLEP